MCPRAASFCVITMIASFIRGMPFANAGQKEERIHGLRPRDMTNALALVESIPMISKLLRRTQVQTTAPYADLANESIKTSGSRVGDSIGMYISSPENK